MKLTGKTDAVAKLEKLREEHVERVETDRRELAQFETIVAGADAERDAITARQVAGELSEDAALDELDELEARVARARKGAMNKRRILVMREADLEGNQREIERARFDAAVAAWREALGERNAAVSAFCGRPSGASLAKLERSREEADTRRAAVAELGEVPVLDEDDEPDFPDWAERVAATLVAGPRQPRRRTAEAIARDNRDRENRDRFLLEQFAKHPSLDAIGQLDERLQPEAHRIRKERMARDQAKVDAIGAGRRTAGV